MLLVIDIGNTNTTLGFIKGKEIVFEFRVGTNENRTSDELTATLNEITSINDLSRKDVNDAIIASVVPNLVYPWTSAIKKYFKIKALVVGEGTKTKIPIKIENPKSLGADRIVNAVGAIRKYGYPVIVVDLGTATTFDVVNSNGEYIGGSIAPGIQITSDALFTRTAKLPTIELRKPERAIAKNTPEAMNSGIVYGYVGLIDAIIKQILEELKQMGEDVENIPIISTGGYSSLLTTSSKYINTIDRNLTLNGLRIIYENTTK
ncbi:MAG: type III pantothenate kinase [Peptoniphilaceae bacterium]|nr:type III pantothenate kinase [Peptoniphilaceae bacterium]MDD7383340.1 type III pantothenate kinase [Peptoniphilaceae bacterium]MDY3738289.1 type III pantothenate kinase [Peptoniphilaceae bacterium]